MLQLSRYWIVLAINGVTKGKSDWNTIVAVIHSDNS